MLLTLSLCQQTPSPIKKPSANLPGSNQSPPRIWRAGPPPALAAEDPGLGGNKVPSEEWQCTCSKQAFTGLHLLIMWESVRTDFLHPKKWLFPDMEHPLTRNARVIGAEDSYLPNVAGMTFHELLQAPSIDTPWALKLQSQCYPQCGWSHSSPLGMSYPHPGTSK